MISIKFITSILVIIYTISSPSFAQISPQMCDPSLRKFDPPPYAAPTPQPVIESPNRTRLASKEKSTASEPINNSVNSAQKEREAKLNFVPSPAIWRLSDEDTEIHFMGTVHNIPNDLKWISPELLKITCSADLIYFDVADSNPFLNSNTQLILQRRNLINKIIDSKNPPIEDRVPSELLPILWKRTGGDNIIYIDNSPAWFIALNLWPTSDTFIQTAYQSETETMLSKLISKTGILKRGLEQKYGRYDILNNIPEEEQVRWLNGLLVEIDSIRSKFRTKNGGFDREGRINFRKQQEQDVLEYSIKWAKGSLDRKIDADKLEDLLKRHTPVHREISNIIINQRNINWTPKIINMLDKPGSFLVAIEIGHLLGENSLQTLLAAKGYKVERIH